jgi:hypothetical protein
VNNWELEFEKLWTIGSIGVQISFGKFTSAKDIEKEFIRHILALCGHQARATALQEAMEVVKNVRREMKIEHTCRFNDGEQDCDCYVEAITEILSALTSLAKD